jgi:hypothetical protein
MHFLVWRQVVFTSVMALLGLLLSLLASVVVGERAVFGVICSVGLCMIPGWLAIFMSALMSAPQMSVRLALVATANRLLFVVMGYLAVSSQWSDLGLLDFPVWLILVYLLSLAIETWLILTPASPVGL